MNTGAHHRSGYGMGSGQRLIRFLLRGCAPGILLLACASNPTEPECENFFTLTVVAEPHPMPTEGCMAIRFLDASGNQIGFQFPSELCDLCNG